MFMRHVFVVFRRDHRSENARRGDHVVQRHRRLHVHLQHRYAIHGRQYVGVLVQQVRRLLWTFRHIQGE